MTLRRRNFLGLMGAAVAVPFMPPIAPAAGYSRGMYALAVAHAQRYPVVSVSGMSKHIGLTTQQVKAIFAEMSSDGLLGTLTPNRPGTIRAVSKICRNDAYGLVRTAQPRPHCAADGKRSPTRVETADVPDPTLDTMLMYLQQMCRDYGMPLSPRCIGAMS